MQWVNLNSGLCSAGEGPLCPLAYSWEP
jgi:hypothetical protein